MTDVPKVVIGQYSQKGRKDINQDACRYHVPNDPFLSTKGIAISLADGISSSNVSQEASQTAVSGFIDEYYSTPESWSVENAGTCVLNAMNSWLYAQTKRSDFKYNIDKGYVCTFSGLIIKGTKAHLFHIGDSRIVHIRDQKPKVLTKEHRTYVSSQESYLSRAIGMREELKVDYTTVPLKNDDHFLLMTDGVYENISADDVTQVLNSHGNDLNACAKMLTDIAYKNGSTDNLTVQIIKVNALSDDNTIELHEDMSELPLPPTLEARMEFDGYIIERKLYKSARSHVFLATDKETGESVVLKTLAAELKEDSTARERFLLEEWIARRVNSANLLKPCLANRKRAYFYIATEYIEGQTLSQWMTDNPSPKLEVVRDIIEQIAKGLLALHRKEMLHQDLRPENIMIDNTGTVKIIDFGAVRVAGIDEIHATPPSPAILGTAQFTAPEYFLGEYGTPESDQFSLAVIAYQMLCGKLPYGNEIARTHTRAQQKRLKYRSVLHDDLPIPEWVDFALRKALHPEPLKRYEYLSEFVYDLRQPNKTFLARSRSPIIERNPVAFWQTVSFLLMLTIIGLLYWR